MSAHSTTQTFTRTNAKYLASKVVADLYQCSRFYGKPAVANVADYETELIELLAAGYLADYEFGFKKDGKRIVTWQYTVHDGDLVGTDDNSGRVYARADVSGSVYYNFASFSDKWFALTKAQRESFEASLPFQRTGGSLPVDGSGYWMSDKNYSNGGTAVTRRTFRPT